MAESSIQITGVDELIRRLNAAPELIREEGAEILAVNMNNIASDAKSNAPANYSFLRQLIGVTPTSNGGLTAGVESNADYSAYVEFGTGTHVEVGEDPEGLPEYALQFKGEKAIPGMIARPFFFPAVRKYSKIIVDQLKALLNRI